MNQVHSKTKTLSLQHITVKVPGQHMPIAKSGSFPRASNVVDHIPNQSDRSESISPMGQFESGSFNGDPESSITVTPSSPVILGREPKSPMSEGDSTDTLDDLTKSDKYPFSHRHNSHVRNNSMDEMTLQLLKTSGVSFSSQPPVSPEDQPRDRSSTLSRIQTKKGKRGKGTLLSPISHSDEELSDPSRTGSQENLKADKKGKKGDKHRNSLVLVERSGSDTVPVRDEHKKDKKTHVGKHRRHASQGFLKTLDVMDSATGG